MKAEAFPIGHADGTDVAGSTDHQSRTQVIFHPPTATAIDRGVSVYFYFFFLPGSWTMSFLASIFKTGLCFLLPLFAFQ